MIHSLLSLLAVLATASAWDNEYDVNCGTPVNLMKDSPVALSIEFFNFPSYFVNVTPTAQCLDNLEEVQGAGTALRIGGNLEDRAIYDPNLDAYVSYSVPNFTIAPSNLTFGPSFFDLAATNKGPVTMGLNRLFNNISNSIEAAHEAIKRIPQLDAIELGNEPNVYSATSPIAVNGTPSDNGKWDLQADINSEVYWANEVTTSLAPEGRNKNIFQGGNYALLRQIPVADGYVSKLAQAFDDAGIQDEVYSYADHWYAQGGGYQNFTDLILHSTIHQYAEYFRPEAEAAHNRGKHFVMGETNSAFGGGNVVSPTYGAALWIVDYVMQMLTIGAERLYFHQASPESIEICGYCWWHRPQMAAPYYGAYFVGQALGGMSSITPLDDGTSQYGVYALRSSSSSSPDRVLLYNSDYFGSNTTGSRSSHDFVLTGLSCNKAKGTRLTAQYADMSIQQGQVPSISGLTFEDATCNKVGEQALEEYQVEDGKVTVTLQASEAVLVYLS